MLTKKKRSDKVIKLSKEVEYKNAPIRTIQKYFRKSEKYVDKWQTV